MQANNQNIFFTEYENKGYKTIKKGGLHYESVLTNGVKCICGGDTYADKKSKNQHLQTKKHKKYIEINNIHF